MSSILITCRNKPAVERHYIPALRRGGWTGAIQVALPGEPLPAMDDPSLGGIAGLLLTGGDDIHPRWWDPEEALHPKAEADEERDGLEIPAVRRAWGLGLPILGICRGEQLLNVALGGSLIQDLPSRLKVDPGLHNRGTSLVPERAHAVAVDPDSRLAALVGKGVVEVNSRHHQAVLRVAPVLKAVAWHREPAGEGEGLVEAVEARDPARWVIGVQWHPENLVGEAGPMGEAALGIFQGFVAELKARQRP